MGLVVLAVMLLVNSPALDFRKIVVHSQLQRLEAKKISPDELDVQYFRAHLARPGYLALETLKTRYAQSNPQLVFRINNLYADRSTEEPESSKQEFIAAVKVSSGTFPDDLASAIFADISNEYSWEIQNLKNYYLMPVDMDNDGQLEYLFLKEMKEHTSIDLYFIDNKKWQTIKFHNTEKNDFEKEFFKAVAAGQFEVIQPKWQDLSIGGRRLHAY